VLNSPIGESLNDKLRQFLGLPPQEPSPKIKEEARGVTEKIRDMKDAPYRVLGVDPSAEEEVVKAAWRAKAKLYHPDRSGSDKKMAEINQAYESICQERGWKL
jgi:preprotein translocase subunit Sec63